tara:strand:- start:14292 stop:14792 length:501 start_codon:yes stop_codon:yes gene_type:complete
MPTIHSHLTIKRFCLVAGFLSISLLNGCAMPSTDLDSNGTDGPSPAIPNDWIPVARYGRYTLMALTPRTAQHNLLLQTVQVSIPTDKAATVGEALDQVLRHSGYSLCDSSAEVSVLHDLSLPASHRHLGPLLLYDALRTLAGPAWVLEVNNTTRQVCFTRTGAPKP